MLFSFAKLKTYLEICTPTQVNPNILKYITDGLEREELHSDILKY